MVCRTNGLFDSVKNWRPLKRTKRWSNGWKELVNSKYLSNALLMSTRHREGYDENSSSKEEDRMTTWLRWKGIALLEKRMALSAKRQTEAIMMTTKRSQQDKTCSSKTSLEAVIATLRIKSLREALQIGFKGGPFNAFNSRERFH